MNAEKIFYAHSTQIRSRSVDRSIERSSVGYYMRYIFIVFENSKKISEMRHNINMKSNLERNVSALRTELNSDEFNIRKKKLFSINLKIKREREEKKKHRL